MKNKQSKLINGDCLTELKKLAENSIDSLVTDPPAGISFMGKDWDSNKGGRDQWIAWMESVMRECLRVLKPGAHGLVWAIPRTSHWTATALENAGFEVRDVITHHFGSGFPKSLDVSKAIDKAAGAERTEVIGTNPNVTGRSANRTAGQVKAAGNAATIHNDDRMLAPATEAAKRWQGWGTALKPASEHWILVRKPLSEKTVAKNVERWGTGAINVDGCRIETSDDLNGGTYSMNAKPMSRSQVPGNGIGRNFIQPSGRFPANLVLSHTEYCTDDQCDIECAIAEMDRQSGTLQSGARKAGVRKGMGFHGAEGDGGPAIEKSSGGASRFFYCAKASKKDKGTDNTHPTVKSTSLMRYLIRMITPSSGQVLDPFTGSGTTGIASIQEGFRFLGIEQSQDYLNIASRRISVA